MNLIRSLFRYISDAISPLLLYLGKWMLYCTLVGIFVGVASALFLYLLNLSTNFRETHLWIISFLPIGGLLIGLSYYYWGDSVVKGNNLLIEEFHNPQRIIPFRMAPLVLFGTVVTHFFGGSAGREGTAVQIGGAIADQLTRVMKLHNRDRRMVLVMGISAGFASVFGTPLAGAIFALEVFIVGRMRYEAIFPSFLVAVIANYVTLLLGATHTHYSIINVPAISFENIAWSIVAGVFFGLTARAFSWLIALISKVFRDKIKYPPLRPFIGGIFIAVAVYTFGAYKYIGLGLPTIHNAFEMDMPSYDFLLKLLFTTFTLGVGFKGGEVTPLFFIGATLGNALGDIIPLPIALLAGMGFVAVFAGATNTPIACIVMGMELFGLAGSVYIAIACIVSYLLSGHTGIYSAQIIGSPKNLRFGRDKGKRISEIKE
ncbi:MAG: voltage-gated chloride channel family protein [Bacteroidales bacterium]